MNPAADDLRHTYAEMSDEELLEVASDYNDLSEVAQPILRDEFRSRKLEPPVIEPADAGEPGNRLDDAVSIAQYSTANEADVARQVLLRAGIYAYVQGERTVRPEFHGPPLTGLFQVQVASRDQQAAATALDRALPPSREEAASFVPPHCPRCKSDDVLLVQDEQNAFELSAANEWECQACGNSWREELPASA